MHCARCPKASCQALAHGLLCDGLLYTCHQAAAELLTDGGPSWLRGCLLDFLQHLLATSP